MRRLNAIENQFNPFPTSSFSSFSMNPLSPRLLQHFTSHEQDDNHGHKLNKRAELDLAKRELAWHKLHSDIDTILPPSIQPYFSSSPDRWIPRSATLISLTGPHPFNAEPPLPLFTNHLITPTAIHFVRNHGTVPNLSKETHQLSVEGLNGEGHRVYSMGSIESFPAVSVVVTIACDGNRRKELNMIRHTNAFSWGAGGVSTSKWTGVRLSDIFRDINIDKDYHAGEALHICFEGCDSLHADTYGTSLDFRYCMDPLNDVILSYRQNDEPLTADHGFPLRLTVPGMVGGRHVKWLSRIWLSTSSTPNWYHHHDNKTLPSSVTTEAAAMAWWPRTPPLYEMNCVAVITQPIHEELIDCSKLDHPEHRERQPDPNRPPPPPVDPSKYAIKGYAYSGGGRRIIQVEVSLDEKASWSPATLHYVDGGMDEVISSSTFRHAKHWSWCQWELQVDLTAFYRAHSIVVRAFDDAMNTQPEIPVWNFLGQMNNSMYCVKVEYSKSKSLRFIHPVQPGQMVDNGWMQRPREEERVEFGGGFATESTMGLRLISLEEIAKHNTKDDCWVVIDGRVYDFTPFLLDHPGGEWAIACWAGKNASAVFHDVHHADVNKQKEMFMIGVVEPPKLPKVLRASVEKETAIQVFGWVDAKIEKKKTLSKDVRLFTLSFPDAKGKKVGLPIGQHVLIRATLAHRRFVVRPYTPVRPIGDEEDDGTMDILLKVYFPKPASGGKPGKPGGLLSTHMESLKEGDTIQVKGPTGSLIYEGKGWMSCQGRSFRVKCINLVCGGTGITPAYQLVVAVLRNKEDETKVALVFSNVSPADVLLREELDDLAEKHQDRFHLFYSVDKVEEKKGGKDDNKENGEEKTGKGEEEWPFNVGHVNEKLVREHLFPPTEDCVCFVCGPPPMLELAVYPALEAYGFEMKRQVLDF